MAAGTITLTNNSTAVTGVGTAFTTDLKVNDFIVATVGGVAYTLGISAIASNTSLTLTQAYTGPTTSGLAWQAVPNATLNLITSALAAQVSYAIRGLNLDKDNWQKVYSGTGNITVTLPDGTSWTGPSWNSLATSLSAAMTDKGNLTSTVDLNTLGAAASWGVYTQAANANALIALNYPEQKAGTLLCTKAAYSGVIQTYIPFDSGQIYTRALSGNWNGTDGPWREWQTVGYSSQTGQFTGNCNTLTTSGRWSISSSATNQAVASTPGTLLVQRRTSATDLYQEFIAIGSSAGATNRTYQRTLSGTTWSPWVELVNGTDSRLNTVDGKTGGTVTSAVTISAPVSALTIDGRQTESSGNVNNNILLLGSSSPWNVYVQYYLATGLYHCFRLIQNSTETFRANSNGACYAVSFNPTSDSRLKFNKNFIGDALSKSMTLRGMTYQIQGETKAGVIAQDAQKILPESVTVGGEEIVLEDGEIINDQLSLDYAGITALNTEALKDVVNLMLECLTDPDSAKAKLTKLVDAINVSTDDANETDMRMEWALVNQPETQPEIEIPVADSTEE